MSVLEYSFSFIYVYYSDTAICTYSRTEEGSNWAKPHGLQSHFETLYIHTAINTINIYNM